MPEFEIIFPKNECPMMYDTYNAITELDLWKWLAIFTPHPNEGFVFASDPNITHIYEALKIKGHSSLSFAWTMRTMHSIAKQGGWEAYVEMMKQRWPKDRPVCRCRSNQGMTIGWCGVAGGGVPGCEH